MTNVPYYPRAVPSVDNPLLVSSMVRTVAPNIEYNDDLYG